MTAVPLLTQEAECLDLGWTAFDPVELSFVVVGADWSGDYTAQIRKRRTRDSQLLAELDVVAVYAAPDTTFTFTLTDSSTARFPGGFWDMQQTDGRTRLRGRVLISRDITVLTSIAAPAAVAMSVG